jgi:hypothetical protein
MLDNVHAHTDREAGRSDRAGLAPPLGRTTGLGPRHEKGDRQLPSGSGRGGCLVVRQQACITPVTLLIAHGNLRSSMAFGVRGVRVGTEMTVGIL